MSGEQVEHPSEAANGSSTSLPAWLLKELERAGVGDEIIESLDEEAARDLVAEIRSDATE